MYNSHIREIVTLKSSTKVKCNKSLMAVTLLKESKFRSIVVEQEQTSTQINLGKIGQRKKLQALPIYSDFQFSHRFSYIRTVIRYIGTNSRKSYNAARSNSFYIVNYIYMRIINMVSQHFFKYIGNVLKT